MDLQDIPQLYSHSPLVAALANEIASHSKSNIILDGLTIGSLPVILAAAQVVTPQTIVIIADDDDTAGYAYNDLTHLLPAATTLFFPSPYKRATRYGQVDPASELLRTETLSRLARLDDPSNAVTIVTYPAAIAPLVAPSDAVATHHLHVAVHQQITITALEDALFALGFTRTDYVYEPGQIAIRGSIVDVFSYDSETPYRIDFFGDEIDTIRTFDLDTQLSRDKKTDITIVPALSTIEGDRVPFLTILPQDTTIITRDISYLRDNIAKIYSDGFSQQAIIARTDDDSEGDDLSSMPPLTAHTMLTSPGSFAKSLQAHYVITFAKHTTATSSTVIPFHLSPQPLFHKNFSLLSTTLADYQQQGYHTYLLADNDKQHQRLRDILVATDRHTTTLPTPIHGILHEGFVDHDSRCCFFTDHQIFDRFHKYHLKSDTVRLGKAAMTVKELQEIEVGDYLVHIDFGIGRFGGLVRKPTNNGYIEEIRLIYQRGDIVDISIHALYKISKYRRNGDTPPRLATLGTGAWEKLKERTKNRIKEVARDLIILYAKRRQEQGYAFAPDSYLQHELEASFIYEDTPDQLRTTQEVKTDMESPRPMDRLICGDVGFGKTEIAVRAAFKACCDNKQVAILVPTTVLAFQHYQTFCARLHDFPVTIDYLSRARSPKKIKEILADLAIGKINILIGTHRLISNGVTWHDLGLLIIDEEQKFGVNVKEKLRQMQTNIDTITMTATPIPRTLQFSLMGARDMSIMRTPPANRYPIATTIATFDKTTISEAINFEMSRNGQVFFVSDRVSSLHELAALVHRLVPDCRVAIAHGQMNPEEMEKILIGFINYDYDVLLSTTIIENGVDIPNANTIIINDAHHFGLADLHQMRGRVGRSNRKAFCYLLAPPLSALPDEARRRLQAVETFADLGAGLALSMQDLDIRGAGNLLGREQSGFIEDLGYETYQKILTQAITELKNDEFHAMYAQEIQQGRVITAEEFVDDCNIESDLEMYFPDEYVPTAAERMLLYRELDNIQSDDELAAYRQRLIDRFGTPPQQAEELLHVVLLRRYGRRAGCEKIGLKQQRMNMQFVSNTDSAFYQSKTFGTILSFIARHPRQCILKETNGKRLLHIDHVATVQQAVQLLKQITTP